MIFKMKIISQTIVNPVDILLGPEQKGVGIVLEGKDSEKIIVGPK